MGILLNIVKGDFIFAQWKEGDWERMRKKVHELRMQGYRKVQQYDDYLNIYQEYRKGKSKKHITITWMCC